MTPFRTRDELSGDADVDCLNHEALGLCPKVFYTESNGNIELVGTDAAEVASRLDEGLDPIAIAEEMALGFELGNRTLFSSVKRLLPWERMILKENKLVVEPEPSPSPPISILDSLSSQVCTAFNEGVALELTGGVDSRLLLASGLRREVKPDLSFTIGEPSSSDVVVASAIAKRYQFAHLTIPLVVNEDRIRRDVIDFVRATGYAVNAACYAWIPGTLSALDSMRSAQMTGLVGELAGSFYYTPFDSMIPRLGLEQSWVKYRLMRPGVVWHSIWKEDVLEQLEASLFRESVWAVNRFSGSWRERTDLLYKNDRIRRWALPVLDASNNYYKVVAPLLSTDYCGWADSLTVSQRPGRRPQRELLREAHPELAAFSVSGQSTEAGGVADLSRKVINRLRRKRRPNALGSMQSAKALSQDREIRDYVLRMAYESNSGFSSAVIEELVKNPTDQPELFGTLVTAALAWHDLQELRSGKLQSSERHSYTLGKVSRFSKKC